MAARSTGRPWPPYKPAKTGRFCAAESLARISVSPRKQEDLMPAILSIGDDVFLLETRAAVLRTTGAEIVSSDASSALPYLERRSFDVVIICHSIPTHLCHTLAEIIHQNWPATRLLRLSVGRDWEEAEVLAGTDFCSSQPQQLVEHTIALLGRRGPGTVKPTFRSTPLRTGSIH